MNHCDRNPNVINGACEIKKSKGKSERAIGCVVSPRGWQTLSMIRTNWNDTLAAMKKKKENIYIYLFQGTVPFLKRVNNERVTGLDAATHKRRTSVN